jgi:hypothetical protein
VEFGETIKVNKNRDLLLVPTLVLLLLLLLL